MYEYLIENDPLYLLAKILYETYNISIRFRYDYNVRKGYALNVNRNDSICIILNPNKSISTLIKCVVYALGWCVANIKCSNDRPEHISDKIWQKFLAESYGVIGWNDECDI